MSIWVVKLISTPKINTFCPYPPPGNENLPLLSTFLVKVTAPNQQFFNLGSLI